MPGDCTQCGGPLGDSPSDDYCSEVCQRLWTATARNRDEDVTRNVTTRLHTGAANGSLC